jgi:hypothetical protein
MLLRNFISKASFSISYFSRRIARVSLTDLGASEADLESNVTQPAGLSPESEVSKKSTKNRRSRKKDKSSLLVRAKYWSRVRVVAPGQDRTNARPLDYTISTVLLVFKLFSKSVLIESSFMKNPLVDAEIPFPIDAGFSGCNLNDLYTELEAIKGFRSTLTNTALDARINQGTFLFTASMITLPFRLFGFKPEVIRRMSSALIRILIDNDQDGNCLNEIDDRFDIATITTTNTIVNDKQKEIFYANGMTLSKSLTREIRPILLALLDRNELSDVWLNQVKRYLYIIYSALSLFDRFLTEYPPKVKKG